MADVAIELTAWTRVPAIAPIILAIQWQMPTAYMWLERVPTSFVKGSAREDSVRLARLDTGVAFDDWRSGRVFDASQELRWQYLDQEFHAVWCGTGTIPPGFTPEPHGGITGMEQRYFLWGRRVKSKALDQLGQQQVTGESVFMQLQIPRVLRYPMAGTAEYARFVVREFYAADGELTYARLCGLEEAE